MEKKVEIKLEPLSLTYSITINVKEMEKQGKLILKNKNIFNLFKKREKTTSSMM